MREPISRAATTAATLGFCALLLNLASTPFSIELGAVALFIAAIGFGLEGAAIASTIGALSLGFITHDYLTGGRLTALALLVGWWTQYGIRRPPIIAVASAWSTVLLGAAAITFLERRGIIGPIPLADFMISDWRALAGLLSDLLAVSLASVLLVTDYGWYTVVKRSRMPSLSNAINHFITLSAVIALCLSVTVLKQFAYWIPEVPWALWPIVISAGYMPTLVTVGLRRLFPFTAVADRRSPLALNPERDNGFSGQSSQYWRRRERTEATPSDTQISRSDILTEGSSFGPDVGICVLDATGAITVCNKRFSKLASFGSRDVVGRRFDSISMTPELARTFLEIIPQSSPFKKTREVRISNKESRTSRFFELAVIPAETLSGALQGDPGTLVLSLREVTERRAIEESLLRSQKLTSLGAVATSISHAFNNALTAIIGRASHARLINEPATMSPALDDIIAEAKRAGALVKRLIDFSADTGEATDTIDVCRLITESRDLLRSVLGTEHSLKLEIPGDPSAVRCDPSLLTQVLTNLLLNARDACQGRSGQITISVDREHIEEDAALLNAAARPGDFVRIRVSDDGHGMIPAVLEQACEPSFTTHSAQGHAGLGLTAAFAVARAHDGFLSIESTPERGTTISVYFPLGIMTEQPQPPELTAVQPAPTASSHPLAQTRVLVLEDEPVIRELLVDMLKSLGASATSFEQPDEALTSAREGNFDIALVDLVMPKMRGDEWLRALRGATPTETNITPKSDTADLPVVLMTGNVVDVASQREFGSVLSKPFTMEELLKVIRTCKRAPNSEEDLPTPKAHSSVIPKDENL